MTRSTAAAAATTVEEAVTRKEGIVEVGSEIGIFTHDMVAAGGMKRSTAPQVPEASSLTIIGRWASSTHQRRVVQTSRRSEVAPDQTALVDLGGVE